MLSDIEKHSLTHANILLGQRVPISSVRHSDRHHPTTDRFTFALLSLCWSSLGRRTRSSLEVRTQMLVLPLLIHLDVVVLVPRDHPLRLIILAKRKGAKKVPYALGAVPLDLDDGIHHHVLREADQALEGLKQLTNGRMAWRFAEVAALPEESGDSYMLWWLAACPCGSFGTQ